jgi:hypothetical protein
LSWVVPLTAAATVVAIWVAVPRTPDAPVESMADAGRQTEERRDRLSSVPVPETQAFREQAQALPAQPAAAGQPKDTNAATANGTQRRTPASQQASTDQEVDRFGASQAAAGGPDAAPPPSSAVGAAAASPAPATAPARGLRSESAKALSERVIPAVVIPSPDPIVRWQIIGSEIQRTTDDGLTWVAVATGFADLRAGASPSPAVCWVVGRGGTVLLSTDGRTFTRIAFPEPVDLSSVRATSARAASIATADGRVFETADGGATWVSR